MDDLRVSPLLNLFGALTARTFCDERVRQVEEPLFSLLVRLFVMRGSDKSKTLFSLLVRLFVMRGFAKSKNHCFLFLSGFL
jgi:hypothetical protein